MVREELSTSFFGAEEENLSRFTQQVFWRLSRDLRMVLSTPEYVLKSMLKLWFQMSPQKSILKSKQLAKLTEYLLNVTLPIFVNTFKKADLRFKLVSYKTRGLEFSEFFRLLDNYFENT